MATETKAGLTERQRQILSGILSRATVIRDHSKGKIAASKFFKLEARFIKEHVFMALVMIPRLLDELNEEPIAVLDPQLGPDYEFGAVKQVEELEL